jgi:amidase
MLSTEFCFKNASDLSDLIARREVSVKEMMDAHLRQIEAVNPKVNAIITLLADSALEKAAAADQFLAGGGDAGPLFGLPVAHKDLVLTKGVRTTYGSPLMKDFIPDKDEILVERLKSAGAIAVGKTNTPEFGAGSQTFNEVFGPTLNPYDITKTCGGSSGGAAVALACGMVPLADGSDLGGSLRNPAGYCNVVGFRPSPGRVPSNSLMGWNALAVEGPMARTVKDVALFLSILAGFDPRSPISLQQPGSCFLESLGRDFKGIKIAWSPDLGGLPVDPRVTAVLEAQRSTFESLGCIIEENEPDFSDADEIFNVLRAWMFANILGEMVETRREMFKDTIIWNVEKGLKLSAQDVADAEVKRTQQYRKAVTFMESYDFMVMPVSQVPPFPVTEPWVKEINGQKMETYLDWMRSCSYITTLGFPAISVPCGFTADGLPVGVQIVGRHLDDFGVLQLAHAFEHLTQFHNRKPEIAL